MNERIKSKALAALLTAGLSAALSAAQCAMLRPESPSQAQSLSEADVRAVASLMRDLYPAQGSTLAPVGHTLAAHGQPREKHASEVAVRLREDELSLFRSLLEAGGTGGPGKRATIERGEEDGLLLTLTLPPYERSHAAGERVLAYRLRVDAQGRGTLAASERIYTRGCVDLASCVPVAEEAGALHPEEARRIVAQLKEFWSLRALKVGKPS